jgi:hypothetical protein
VGFAAHNHSALLAGVGTLRGAVSTGTFIAGGFAMPATLTIRDQSAAGATLHEMSLDFLSERVTVRELIRSRVYQEVKDHNVRAMRARSDGPAFRGLVQPETLELDLNVKAPASPRQIDWKRQFDVALDAFRRKGFLILVDDRQHQNLDEEIEIKPGTEVSFVKLVPLVGG